MTDVVRHPEVLSPNLGLYYNRSALLVPRRGLVDGYNFRIKDGKINNYNLGWEEFGITLDDRVMKIFTHTDRTNGDTLFFADPTDIYKYNPAAGGSVAYMTPRYQTGTASSSGTTVTGIGTLFLANTKVGDYIHFGAANYTDPTGTWFLITNVGNDTTLTISPTSGVVAAGVYTIRKTYITTTAEQWVFRTFLNDATSGKDIMFATNYVDWVQTWSFGDTQMTAQSGFGFKCKTLRPYYNMMLYANLLDAVRKPTSMTNSDVSKPLAAGSLGTGLAEEFIVHDGVDEVDSIGLLGNSVIFYSEKHINAAQFVGSPEVFTFRKIDREIGPVGPFAVTEFGDYHEFLGPDGGYRFDGVGATEVHPHVMRHVRAQMDPARKKAVYTQIFSADGEVIWSVPGRTDPGVGTVGSAPVVGWTEHYLEDVGMGIPRPWSRRAIPFTAMGKWTNSTAVTWADMDLTWADYAMRWSDLASVGSTIFLAGDVNGKIWILNASQNADGVGLPSFVQFPRFAGGDMHQKNVLQRWNPYVTPGVGNITVTTFFSHFATGVLSSDAGLPFDTSFSGEEFVSPMIKARFFGVQFGSPTGLAYQIEGYNYELLGVTGGRR